MNKSDMPTRYPMKSQLAGDTETKDPEGQPTGDRTDIPDDDTGESGILNFEDGFTDHYNAPYSASGKYVKRGDINAIAYIATNDLFYHKCGGLNTFDAAHCAKINGYPEGAVLDYLVGDNLYKVISLLPDNSVDYTISGPDGVSWKLLNVENAQYDTNGILLRAISKPNAFFNILPAKAYAVGAGTFTAPKDGVLYVSYEGTIKYAPTDPGNTRGLGVIVYDTTPPTGNVLPTIPDLPTVAKLNDIDDPTLWSLIYSTGLTGNVGATSTTFGTVTTVNATRGHTYAVAYFLYANYSTPSGSGQSQYDEVSIDSINIYIS